ncbi:glycoside hydrolase family 6 protein [Streptomyces sp. NPDC050560]|uniref:glycoside hydrolase family 6 protein n=1 Tax=Streptomyces sp. NPDC050560 TaxID=3365630 RepID=UPI0037937A1D
MYRLIRTFAALALLGGLGLPAGCSSGGGVEEASVVRGPSSGATDSPFWTDPDSPAAWQVRQWREQGRDDDAKVLQRVAQRPVAIWPAGQDPARMMGAATEGARGQGKAALFVAYDIPHRDCGQHSAGGAQDGDAYRGWIDRFARAIGDTRAWVVLEPDAVAHIVDGCTPREYHDERYALLSGAIDRLKQQPHTRVYLDAGNPAWIRDPWQLREPLARAGLAHADGFSLNVSNFQTNADTIRYGRKLSQFVGDKHFVIDTSRNGNGPLPGRDGGAAWCNPPGRALGTPPTTRTGDPLVDAFLWIKRPGESDGTCRGGPAAGKWWPEYALGLARAAKE